MAPIRLKGNAWNKTELVTLTPVGTVLAVTRKLKQETAIPKASTLRTRTKGTPGVGVWFKMQGKAEQCSRGLVKTEKKLPERPLVERPPWKATQ
jgi:hypothetical protein